MRAADASRIDEWPELLVGRCHSRIDLVVSEYLAARIAGGASVRRRHLQAPWSAAGCFEVPLVSLAARAVMCEHVERHTTGQAGLRFVVTSDVMRRHESFHIARTLLDVQGVELLAGNRCCARDDEGRMRHLVGFFDAASGAV